MHALLAPKIRFVNHIILSDSGRYTALCDIQEKEVLIFCVYCWYQCANDCGCWFIYSYKESLTKILMLSFQICFLLFAVLYIVSYCIITRYKRKSGECFCKTWPFTPWEQKLAWFHHPKASVTLTHQKFVHGGPISTANTTQVSLSVC